MRQVNSRKPDAKPVATGWWFPAVAEAGMGHLAKDVVHVTSSVQLTEGSRPINLAPRSQSSFYPLAAVWLPPELRYSLLRPEVATFR